ncbi:hypothetical protein GLOIN_2v1870293 [Rhizophagus irregularis DAOM 181602=DAOM 197198]|uniref:Uncharacterized protein n=1 Tax=Rhizophagus irregularis (strain DAOM 181602 / DAOM 197198 / MUCL 43194) TaxID=747089 RepID=A0A2P4QM47_RHIID|nr:hypothetical protein GLOIN_2v1870293 [Rhizophagus irregularis DAOM 181602=DAOM 197198]POG78721.1 hypothetical protein GLOIN_2v1870293 [Rhizophagus irregularis DAOM 181602=DAOM 197198]|eukprot:XP_025185587.1 hypothetical protein GLOIN_2v1870293 [Rhizophagus irregularis DAOM 181602=DAOM 197198]
MNISVMTRKLAKPISIFLFRTLGTLLGREHKLLNIDVGVNEIGLELMLGYYVSIDSLDERNTGVLLAENAKIKAENAEVKAENAKLRQAIEENEARFVKLEQSDKEKAELIAELNCDIRKIKQEQIAINVLVQDGTSVVKSSTCSELQVTSQSSISPPIEGNSENSSNVTQSTHAGSKLLEDRQTDEFLISNNSSMPLEDSVETETNTSSSQSSIKLNEDDVQVIDGNQELTTDMTIEVELAHLFLEVSIEGKNTTQAKQKEISCRYSYGKRFEESVQEIIARNNVSDQTARKQLFQDIIKHLSGITLETLRKRTQRAIKIYKLFEKIGVDRIKNIKSYSADSISKFTKPQIQIILNYFGGSCYADTDIKNPNSYSECKDIEKVSPKFLLEKSQGSVPKKLPDVKICTLPTSQTLKTNQTNALEVQEKYLDSVEVSTSANVFSSSQSNPTYNRTYFRNKILDQYSNLYRECSIENFDYCGITDETTCGDYICPLCKLGHDDALVEIKTFDR